MDMIPLFGCSYHELKETSIAWNSASDLEKQIWIDTALDLSYPISECETDIIVKDKETQENISIDDWVEKYMDLSWPEEND